MAFAELCRTLSDGGVLDVPAMSDTERACLEAAVLVEVWVMARHHDEASADVAAWVRDIAARRVAERHRGVLARAQAGGSDLRRYEVNVLKVPLLDMFLRSRRRNMWPPVNPPHGAGRGA
ncbi:hypothetical protein [Pilimelia terevasa]|nr:hypothetical protein [Pilimelia terevasa]